MTSSEHHLHCLVLHKQNLTHCILQSQKVRALCSYFLFLFYIIKWLIFRIKVHKYVLWFTDIFKNHSRCLFFIYVKKIWLAITLFCVWMRCLHFLWCKSVMCMCGQPLQSCPALFDPLDCSLPGPCVHGISYGRILECCVLSHFNRVQLFVTPWIVVRQAPLSMGFSRQDYWSGLSFPHQGDLPNPGTEPRSPELQVDYLLLSHWGSPNV